MRLLIVWVALFGAMAISGAVAQQQDSRLVPGFSYLFSTNLLKKQAGDVFSTIPGETFGAAGATPQGMHRCAKACKKEGPGVCAAFTWCWDEEPKCALLSRLPSPLAPARPGGTVWERATGAATYNPKCASGYSEAAKVLSELQSSCRAKIHPNTALSDATAAWVVGAPGAGGGGAIGALFRRPSRDLDIQYDAAQPTASACCQLCESLRGRGCTAWTFTPNPVGFMVDRSRRCALRTGLGPSMARAAGVTSGVMQ